MGLDMFLHIKCYTHDTKLNEMYNISKDYCASEVVFTVAQWRKANAIHNWFVINVQKEKDDCKEYYVKREHLQTLLDLCKSVKNNPSIAPQVLPTVNGFFFGSCEYDEWYFEDLDYTIETITKILNDKTLDNIDFYYQSSW